MLTLVSILVVLALLWYTLHAISRLESSPLLKRTDVTAEAFPYQLRSRFVNIQDDTKYFALFQSGDRYWIYSEFTNQGYDLLDIYPSFRGEPVGIVALPASLFGEPQIDTSVFVLWSTDGKIYNPVTISESFWTKAFFLPVNAKIVGVDAVLSPQQGLTLPGVRFHYYLEDGTIVQEEICTRTYNPSLKFYEQSCKHSTRAWTRLSLPLAITNDTFAVYGTHLYRNGKKDLPWKEVYPDLSLPRWDPPMQGSLLQADILGIDFHQYTPIYLIQEEGRVYLVDHENRRYNFRKLFKQTNVFPVGGIIDIASIGDDEYDFIVAATDGFLYCPLFPRIPIASLYSYSQPLVSISGVQKYIEDELRYFIVLFYADGRYVERELRNGVPGIFGDTHQNWKAWLPKPMQGKYFLSCYNWTIFSMSERKVYSRNDPVFPLEEILECTYDEYTLRTPYCTNNMRMSQPSFSDTVKFEQMSTHVSPMEIHRKIGLAECIQKMDHNVVSYNTNTCDCAVYDNLRESDLSFDPTTSTYFPSSFMYKTMFCVRHKETQKYLYVDLKTSRLGLKDRCLEEETTEDANYRSLGALWKFDRIGDEEYLASGNEALGGFLKRDFTFAPDGTGPFYPYSFKTEKFATLSVQNNTIVNGLGDPWVLTSIKCPSYATEPGYEYLRTICEP